MKIRANGIEINCAIDGLEGAPWVVFSNSLMTDLTMWDDQIAPLSRHYRVLRYDQRGHGGTQVTPAPYSFDLLADDVIGLFDALAIDRAHFVGLSMGGVTAMTLATRNPERLHSVVACDCVPASTPASAQQWAERVALARDKGMEALVDVTVNRWYPSSFVETKNPVLDRIRAMIRTTPIEGFAGCAGALSQFDLRTKLESVRTPLLLMCGSKDATLHGIKQFHEAISGSQFVELDGAGHISNTEKPEEFSATLERFFRR